MELDAILVGFAVVVAVVYLGRRFFVQRICGCGHTHCACTEAKSSPTGCGCSGSSCSKK